MAGRQAPLVILTRPQGQNDHLAVRLGAAGLEAMALPALAIRALEPDASGLPLPHDYDLVIFASGNAVRLYLGQWAKHGGSRSWPRGVLAATVGEASARPLYDAGFIDSRQIIHPLKVHGAQDSESLWSLLAPRAAQFGRVLIVRGDTGRAWLGQQLESAGATVRYYPVYRRERARWTGDEIRELNEKTQFCRHWICLLTSNQSAQAVHDNLVDAGLEWLWEGARFVVIHERIADWVKTSRLTAGTDLGCAAIGTCAPDEDAIFQSIVQAASL